MAAVSSRRRSYQGVAVALAAAGAFAGALQTMLLAFSAGRGNSRGPMMPQTPRRTNVPRASVVEEAPQLVTELGVDYSRLRDLLEVKDFKEADAETRRLLIELAGPAATKRGWVYFNEVRSIPDADMQTIDTLWQHFSGGKFGFVPQRKVWRQCREQFDKFALEVSWFTDNWQNRNWPDEFVYSLDAPRGHLPLTNCIRGAQVLQEILNHEAYVKKKVVTSTTSTSQRNSQASTKKRSALEML
jgi:hypothetical protein